jgi:hypothetical protein
MDFLSHYILTRITDCTAKKRVLFGSHDVDCDSAHVATTLSLPLSCLEVPVVWVLGEGALQKTSIFQLAS